MLNVVIGNSKLKVVKTNRERLIVSYNVQQPVT